MTNLRYEYSLILRLTLCTSDVPRANCFKNQVIHVNYCRFNIKNENTCSFISITYSLFRVL